MDAKKVALPLDVEDQVYASVYALYTGGMWMADYFIFEDCIDGPPEAGKDAPTIAFLISHPTLGYALYDLGMRKVTGIFCIFNPVKLIPRLSAC